MSNAHREENPETAASSELCSSNCASIIEEIQCQAVTAPATLAVSPAADHILVGRSGVRSLEHVHSGLRPVRANHERERERERFIRTKT